MTNSVTSSTQMLPTVNPAQPVGADQPAALPAVAGGPVETGSIVDRALTDVLGTSVTGGGADAPSSDPSAGIPEFVRQFLPAEPGGRVPDAQLGVAAQDAAAYGPPSKQASEPQQSVQRGWAWIGCQPGNVPPVPQPPVDQLPPSGDEVPPSPPGKGEPPMKGTPPMKTGPVDQAGPADRGTHTVGRGEHLSAIAPRYGVTWQQLYWANRDDIKHPDLIQPGQVLKIPSRDLKVPDFPYTPMFTGKPGKADRGTHTPGTTPPAKGGAPGKTPPSVPPGKTPPTPSAPPKGEAPPTPPPSMPRGTKPPTKADVPDATPPRVDPLRPPRGERPPGAPATDGVLPSAPPAPGTGAGDLPPALPG